MCSENVLWVELVGCEFSQFKIRNLKLFRIFAADISYLWFMNLTPDLDKQYTTETKTALQAQRLAQEIAFAPIAFQVSHLMVKLGILEALYNAPLGLSQAECYGAVALCGAGAFRGFAFDRDGNGKGGRQVSPYKNGLVFVVR